MTQTELTLFTLGVSVVFLVVVAVAYLAFLAWRKRDRANRH